MSKYTDLRNRVRNLQRELDSLQSTMNRKLSDYQRSSQKRINELQNNMNMALKEHDEEMQEQYYRILNDFQQKTISSHNREMNKLKNQYSKLQDELLVCEEELKKESSKLKKDLEEIKHDIEDKEEKSKTQSDLSLKKFFEKYDEFNNIPHEVFFPDKLKTYMNYGYAASNLHDNGMHNASVALSESGTMLLDIFKYDIDRKIDEWRIAFQNYENQYKIISSLINSSQNRIRNYCRYKLDLTNDNIFNYWSNREFSEIITKLNLHSGRINEIYRFGIEKYMLSFRNDNSDDLLSIEMMEEYINELSYLLLQYNKTCEFAFRNLYCFCTRLRIKDIIIDLLEENNFELEDEYCEGVRNGRYVYEDYKYMYENYIKKEEYSVQYPDYRERYVLKLKKATGDIIYFFIYPNVYFNTSTETSIFNFYLKNSIFCEIIPKSVGGIASVDELWDELNDIVLDRLEENKINNCDMNLINDSKSKSNMMKIEVVFSSELSDDEKITINRNNMSWKNKN